MYAGVVGLGLYAPHFGKKLMNIMKLEMPEMPAPKQGGMIDSIKHGRFVEYLAGEWPNDWENDWELKRDEQIENETNDILMEK